MRERDKRHVKNHLKKNKFCSSNEIKNDLDLDCSSRTIRRYLNELNLKYSKMKKKPLLIDAKKKARSEWCLEKIRWKKEWNFIWFSDEKRFCLDGPDGINYYWHGLSDHEKDNYCAKRKFGGGGIMVWGAISYFGKTEIVFIEKNLNSLQYIEIIKKYYFNFIKEYEDYEDFTFQQDNASVHTSKKTMRFFSKKGINILGWPANSPDLNPIENVWGILVRSIYRKGTINSIPELKRKIKEAWDSITLETLRKLVCSMEDRVFLVLKNEGGSIDY